MYPQYSGRSGLGGSASRPGPLRTTPMSAPGWSARQRLRRIFLRTASYATRLIPRERPSTERPRLLVIRPDHLGDILFLTPALAYLRWALPDWELSCLVGPWATAVLEPNPNVDHVIECLFPGFTRCRKGSLLEPYALLW